DLLRSAAQSRSWLIPSADGVGAGSCRTGRNQAKFFCVFSRACARKGRHRAARSERTAARFHVESHWGKLHKPTTPLGQAASATFTRGHDRASARDRGYERLTQERGAKPVVANPLRRRSRRRLVPNRAKPGEILLCFLARVRAQGTSPSGAE